VYNLLSYHEFPILIDYKRTLFAEGIIAYSRKRNTVLDTELDLLRIMQEHYKKY